MNMRKLVETVSKKPIPPTTKQLTVEVMANDEEGEDVEVRDACTFLHSALTDEVFKGSILGGSHLT